MLAILILVIGLTISSASLLITDNYSEQMDVYRQELGVDSMQQISSAIDENVRHSHHFPNQAQLRDMAGEYERALSFDLVKMGYATSPVTSLGFQGERAIIFYLDPDVLPHESFLGGAAHMNACGDTTYENGESWCLPTIAKAPYVYQRLSTDEYAREQISTQHTRLKGFARKLAEYYRANGTFPTLAQGTHDIRSLIGLPNTASCNGLYEWDGIPLDCSNIDTVWASTSSPSPIQIYRDQGDGVDLLVLFAKAPFKRADGADAVVYFDIRL